MIPAIYDTYQFFRTLTLSKTVNIIKIRISYIWSIIRRKAVTWGRPYSLSIEPVNFCNLACPECIVGANRLTRFRKSLDTQLYNRIIEENCGHMTYLMLYFQGEPFLHARIFDLIRVAVQKRIYTAISTNAQLINDRYAGEIVRSGLQRIIISMDGITQETYEQYRRNGKLTKVLDAVSHIRKWRKQLNRSTPYIVVQFIVFRTNQHELPDVRSFALKAGADKVEIKTAQLYGFENGNPLLTDIDKYARYKKQNDHYVIKSRLPNHCFRLWSGAVITVSGEVIPCCFDKDADYIAGNLCEDSLENIWNGKAAGSFRNRILSDRKQFDMCRNCTGS